MKKYLLFLITLFLIFLCGCSGRVNMFAINTEKMAEEYVKSQGYSILENKGEVLRYKLEKNLLSFIGPKNTPYIQMWSVQKADPDNYLGKEILIYRYIVGNHPLEKIYHVKTNIYIMVSDSEIIGGYSFSDNNSRGGWACTLDGKTLEEFTGLDHNHWRSKWNEKYLE